MSKPIFTPAEVERLKREGRIRDMTPEEIEKLHASGAEPHEVVLCSTHEFLSVPLFVTEFFDLNHPKVECQVQCCIHCGVLRVNPSTLERLDVKDFSWRERLFRFIK